MVHLQLVLFQHVRDIAKTAAGAVLTWQDFFPDTPPAIAAAPFPAAAALPSLLDLCEVSECAAVVRVSTRVYSASILAIKIRTRAAILQYQRAVLEHIIRARELERAAAEFAAQSSLLEGWTLVAVHVLHIQVPNMPEHGW